MNYLINGIRGFCMALADSVPGVSGGTIAFILGFYDQFINSLNNFIHIFLNSIIRYRKNKAYNKLNYYMLVLYFFYAFKILFFSYLHISLLM